MGFPLLSLWLASGIAAMGAAGVVGPHLMVMGSSSGRIIPSKATARREIALVLGAGVRGDSLSGALRSRMEEAIALYRRELVGGILLSGDGGTAFYNETQAMERYAQKNGILPEHMRRDDRGFSTHASIARARAEFGVDSAYVVTQGYHLSRALWLAQTYGIDALGVSAGEAVADRTYYELREFPARIKDFYSALLLLEPQSKR